ncbi:CrcB family protein [Myxococcota bacterium]|nr:CrcB family protein [Myxococcota bacterium]
MTPTSALLVALGGALGALARVGLGLWLTRVYAPSFPWVTLGVNTLGCLLLGILVGLTPSDDEAQRMARLALGGGFLGAFTTWSTFSIETITLVQTGRTGAAALNLGLSLVLGLGAGALGLHLSR